MSLINLSALNETTNSKATNIAAWFTILHNIFQCIFCEYLRRTDFSALTSLFTVHAFVASACSSRRHPSSDIWKTRSHFVYFSFVAGLYINKHSAVPMSLLRDCPKRLTIFPISEFCMPIWKAYKLQVTKFWTPEELDFKSDLQDWLTLEEDEKDFLLRILAFFAISDSVVLENLNANFCSELDNPEAVAFYTFQAMMENVHAETYSILLDMFCTDADKKKALFGAVETLPSVAAKVSFARQYMDPAKSHSARLIAFACVEGILFSGSFCAIYWLKHFKQKCPGLTLSNEFIARDEGMHCEFAVLLYTKYTKKEDKLTVREVRAIVQQALEVEKIFILNALPRKLTGMNKELMTKYVTFVADRLCKELCGETLYPISKNPFPWMEQISLGGKTNFFEKRVSEYNKAGVLDDDESTFDFDMSNLS